MNCVLFSGGSMYDYTAAEEAVKSADLIICADSGILYAEKLGIVPDVWVGDLDSVDGDHHCKEFIKLPIEKDDTDTMSAARIMIERKVTNARLFGCTGTRLDHTFGNLFVLKFLLDNEVNAVIEDYHNEVWLLKQGTNSISAKEGFNLSLLPFCCEAEISRLSGVKYPLTNAVLTDCFPIGISNLITEKQCEIEIAKGTVAVFLSRD